MNHQPAEEANVAMQWFSRVAEDDALDAWKLVSEYTVEELPTSTIMPLDIAFYAIRDIEAGEELFIDYCDDWVDAWIDARCYSGDESGCDSIGKFRSYIGVEEGLFPEHWHDE